MKGIHVWTLSHNPVSDHSGFLAWPSPTLPALIALRNDCEPGGVWRGSRLWWCRKPRHDLIWNSGCADRLFLRGRNLWRAPFIGSREILSIFTDIYVRHGCIDCRSLCIFGSVTGPDGLAPEVPLPRNLTAKSATKLSYTPFGLVCQVSWST